MAFLLSQWSPTGKPGGPPSLRRNRPKHPPRYKALEGYPPRIHPRLKLWSSAQADKKLGEPSFPLSLWETIPSCYGILHYRIEIAIFLFARKEVLILCSRLATKQFTRVMG